MKIKIFFSIAVLLLNGFIFVKSANSQENNTPTLDYGKELILDSDLDGLTDLGEKKIFKTDPQNPDSDGDGFYDGAEVLNKTDPLDSYSPVATKVITEKTFPVEREIAWPWYVARATGLISFILLYLVMFLGLSIRTPILKKIIAPIDSFNIHAWLSVQALILVFIHGGALLFDKFLKFRLVDVAVPFASPVHTDGIAMGIFAMYLMIILIVTSYLKRFMKYKAWRAIHFLNIILYLLAVFHSLHLGTDLSGGVARSIFIYANILLIIIMFVNLSARWVSFFRSKRETA